MLWVGSHEYVLGSLLLSSDPLITLSVSQKSGIGRHQWNVALSQLPFVIRVRKQEWSTRGL